MNEIFAKENKIAEEILKIKGPFSINQLQSYLVEKDVICESNQRDMKIFYSIFAELRESRNVNYIEVIDDFFAFESINDKPETRIVSKQDSRKFIDQEDFTSYEFLVIFISLLKIRGINNFNIHLLKEFINKCKKDNKLDFVLCTLDFDQNTKNIIKLSEVIGKAFKDGIIYVDLVSNVNKINISKSIDAYKNISTKADYLNYMLEFVNEFLEFEKTMNGKNNKKHIPKNESLDQFVMTETSKVKINTKTY